MAAAVAQPSAQDIIAAQARYGPNAGMAIQRSQYLAQALQSLQQNAQQNIRTPGALGANLLASAILQFGKQKSDLEAMNAFSADRRAQDAAATKDTPLDPNAPPAAAAPAPPPQDPGQISSTPAPTPPPAPPPPAQASATPAAAPQAAPDPLLVRMMMGEAGGEGPDGMKAVGHVALNRLASGYGGAKTLDQVLTAKNQFQGLNSQNASADPSSPQYQKAAALAAQISGEPDPTNGAVNFINPALQAQQGRPMPAWAPPGQGQQIGHQMFYGGHPGAQMAQAQTAPDPNMAAGVNPYAPPPVQQPPSPPASVQGAAGPAPGPAGPLPSPGPGAVAPSGPPHNYVSPQEWQNAASLLHDPRTHDMGLQQLMQLKERAASAIAPPKDMMWGPDGRAVPIPGTQFTQRAGPMSGVTIQSDPFGKQEIQTVPNMSSAPPSGYDRDPNNPSHLIPLGVGGQSAATANPKTAPIPPALQDAYMKTLDTLHHGPGYTDYVNSVNAANALESNLQAAAKGNNGVVSQAVTDNLIRAMTGLSARQGSVNSMLDHLPWSEQLKGFIQKAIGPTGSSGFLTPTVLGQMRDAIHAYADGHRPLAEQEYEQANKAAQRIGIPDLGQELPTVAAKSPIQWLDGAAQPQAPARSTNPKVIQYHWSGREAVPGG